MYVLVFYVPATHLETVKDALFRAGAGAVGDYSRCAWQVKGTGQFQPGGGSTPFIGARGRLEEVEEYRVELVCPAAKMKEIAGALLESHPYEEPAYHFFQVMTAGDL